MSGDKWLKAVPERELLEGVPASVKIGEATVALVRKNGKILALDGECSHYGGPLAEGLLRGRVLTCPWHTARFDLETGRALAPPALSDVGRYETKIEAGTVFVRRAKAVAPARPRGRDARAFLILGAGAAGTSAALALRSNGFPGRVMMITAEPDLPYDRPSLSKAFLSGELKAEELPLRPADDFQALGIEILRDKRAVGLDREKKKVRFSDGSALAYDRLLLATGGTPRVPDLPGTDRAGFFLLRSLADAQAILRGLDRAATVAVLGAGFIGLEVASSLVKRGLAAHVVTPESLPLARIFGDRIGARVLKLQERNGVRFHLGRKAVGILGGTKAEGLGLDDGTEVRADAVVAGIGIRPAVGYLEGTGLERDGAVPVDARLRTADPDVFAAGDIALLRDPRIGEPRRVEHWIEAERQGRHAALAMLGAADDYLELPFFWTVQHGMSLKYSGFLPSFDTVEMRGDPQAGRVLAGYYRGGRLLAAATIGRTRELIAVTEAIKAGIEIPPQRFRDEAVDLRELLPPLP